MRRRDHTRLGSRSGLVGIKAPRFFPVKAMRGNIGTKAARRPLLAQRPRSIDGTHRKITCKTEASMIRKAKAVWRGTGRAGSGNLSTDSGVLAETPYSFRTRFENEKGTNPEELIAAAHA